MISNRLGGLAVMAQTDVLFVGVLEGQVLAFSNASSLSGNVAPTEHESFGDYLNCLAVRPSD